MPEPTSPTKPLCAHCHARIDQLGVWIDDDRKIAMFFCSHCHTAFGAQLLTGQETHFLKEETER